MDDTPTTPPDLAVRGDRERDRSAETVHVDGSSSSSSWDAFLARLRDLGPAWRRYDEREAIDTGGMGAISRVRDTVVGRSVAMKVIRDVEEPKAGESADVDDRTLGRFLEEAQVTGQLDHPNIVPVHDVGLDEEGRVFFTMKLVRGDDLRAVFREVRDDGEWTKTRVLSEVILRVCDAMAFAHDKGVLHRDLKPGNVMVGRFGEVYVMDWGLARILGEEDRHDLRIDAGRSVSMAQSERRRRAEMTPDAALFTMDGQIVGTPAYMPPEQARGDIPSIGPHSDVYAVGAMIYHLLAGHMPYVPQSAVGNPYAIWQRVQEGPPVSLHQEAPDTPAELIAICERAMARDVGERYPDMRALAADLRAFLSNRVVSAYRTGAWEELKLWTRRNRSLAATAALAMVSVTALSIFALLERGKAREHARRAEQSAQTARDEARRADLRADDLLRLSDARRLAELKAETDALWPAHPALLERMDGWLSRAADLAANLAGHEEKLAELRRDGVPIGVADTAEEMRARSYDFGEDTEASWWHDAVRDLVVDLHAFQDDDPFRPTIASVVSRRRFAATVLDDTVTGDEAVARWDDARAAIREHPLYGGLDISPQIGLLPLGADAESTLWEFWHVASGARPTRGPDGRHEIAPETGVVLVLIPGGEYPIGAQRDDPEGELFDPAATAAERVERVAIEPFFLSKYELTLAQWQRATGGNPSWWLANYPTGSTTQTCPIENISWHAAVDGLRRLGLQLPTQSQWEVAARAGATTPWYCGADATSLATHANIADRSFRRTHTTATDYESFDDGADRPTEVGRYQPNRFGLFDVHGNVWEWCLDPYHARARQGGEAPNRVIRGGSYYDRAHLARLAYRHMSTPDFRGSVIGCRPARPVDP